MRIHKSHKNASEFDCVNKIRKGDECAFRDLFKAYYQRLVNYARRYVHDTDIAENIVEDVFLKIWNDRKKLHIAISLQAYLFKAVRNHSLNYVKRLKLEHKMISDLAYSPNRIETPEEHFIEKEMHQQIQQAISELPERSRTVFTMHRYDNLKYSEIAEILDISVGTVETHMVRALRSLRDRVFHLFFILI